MFAAPSTDSILVAPLVIANNVSGAGAVPVPAVKLILLIEPPLFKCKKPPSETVTSTFSSLPFLVTKPFWPLVKVTASTVIEVVPSASKEL